ncbi:MAG: FG-GAP-like repeat-containing protein [bacterium]
MSSVAWGDYDQDGELDILMAGKHDGLHSYTFILRNDGYNQFTDLGEHFPGLQSASVAWVDYNNDGKLDVMISGDSGGGMITQLYKQEDGKFTEVNPGGFMGLSTGDTKWGDLDNDGDMDLILAGVDLFLDGYILLYENTGNDTFIEHFTLNNNISFTSLDLGDFNNDGWLDIILSGKIVGCGGTAATMLFRNEIFLNFTEMSTLIPGYKQGEVCWGDFNNDGFTDLIFTGFDGYDVPNTHLYKNDAGSGIFTVNTPPELPPGLTATTSGSTVTISWGRATDAQPLSYGLSYNVFVGTSSGTGDIFSANSNLGTGLRYLATLGNTSQDTSWEIKGLEDGTYYWSVQAIDNGFLGSVFSEEETFTIDAVGINDWTLSSEIKLNPNPAHDVLDIRMPDIIF